MSYRAVAILPLTLLVVVGCGEKGPPPGAPIGTPSPVHGTITFADKKPLKGGIVTFFPTEFQAGSKLRYEGSGLVDDNGHYTAGRNGDDKGLVPGEYVVVVEPREVSELPGSNSKSIPREYREKKTTPLKVKVEESDNTIDLVLK